MKTIRPTVQFLGHTSRSCYRVHKLPNSFTADIRADRAMSRNNTDFFVDTWVPMSQVDKLTVVAMIFSKRNRGDLSGCTEKLSLNFSKRFDRLR